MILPAARNWRCQTSYLGTEIDLHAVTPTSRSMKASFTWAAAALALTFALVACANAGNPVPSTSAAPEQPATNSTEAMSTPVAVPEATAPAAATAQLNPPHGEPGHRCEIPVGAPLDGSSAPAATSMTVPPASGTTAPVVTAPPSPATGATGKINPPHGEPGHDCAVPVGSLLPG